MRIRGTLALDELEPGPLGDRYRVLEALGRWLSPAVIRQVLTETGVAGRRDRKRNRKLNAMATLLLCVAMNLWRQEELSWVFRELVSGVRWLLAVADTKITRAVVSRARYRLGAAPLERLFRLVCHPLATEQTPGAFRFGRRMMAIDSTDFDLADTKANAAAFGRPHNQRAPGGWPQAQLVALCECGTHAICDAEFAPRLADPRALAHQLLRSVTAEMLVMLDQGLYGFDLFAAIRGRQAHFLARVLPYVRPTVMQTLADGTQLVQIAPSRDRRVDGEHMLLRLIRYTIDDTTRPGHGVEHRLLTSLLDPAEAPALELILTYHDRWEEELTIDEIATHQLTPIPMRSKSPEGVRQELYGLLLAHHLVRTLMVEAAAAAPTPLDPTELSFLGSLRLIREALPDFQRYHPHLHATIHARLLQEIAATRLPPRANRSNPRVVKQRCSPFPVKRPFHRHWPQPTRPFAQAVVLLS
ncbi:MAG TPA: IS4 family transposase [Chloroflexota bacterium]